MPIDYNIHNILSTFWVRFNVISVLKVNNFARFSVLKVNKIY